MKKQRKQRRAMARETEERQCRGRTGEGSQRMQRRSIIGRLSRGFAREKEQMHRKEERGAVS
jgi:hypothetical protein